MRCLSDKLADDGISKENKAKEAPTTKKSSDNATEKIQELLKSMLAEPKISEKEYAEKFTTAPDHRRKKNVLETKSEKIGKVSPLSLFKSVLQPTYFIQHSQCKEQVGLVLFGMKNK